MSSLLTREEYASIARTGAFIDGKARSSTSGETFETYNPSTGAPLNRISANGREDVDLAVRKAHEAFEDGRWAKRR